MSEQPTPVRPSLFSGKQFNRLMAMTIATVTVLATVVGFLEHAAIIQSAQARRDATRYAIQAMGQRSSGAVRVGYDWTDAYRSWSEMDLLAALAQDAGDASATRRYRAVRDRLGKLSPLLAPPYFDPKKSEKPDLSAYEAEVYLVSSTALSEHFTDLAEVDELWVSKADTYVLHLSLFAAALALFGLAMTMFRRVRSIFVITGALLVIGTLAWTIVVFLQPIKELPDPAIDAYAKGFGLAYRNDNAGAIVEFDRALAQAPDYGNALYQRGRAYYALGKYEEALVNYREAIHAHQDKANVNWDLGWTLYLLGRFDEAAQADMHAMELDPGIIGVRFNRALAHMSAGQIQAAQKDYAGVLDLAARQVAEAQAAGREPPSDLWIDLEEGATDLTSLVDRLSDHDQSWTEAPPRTVIANAAGVLAAAREQMVKIKEFNVALEYTGAPPAGAVTAQITPIQFGYKADETASDFTYNATLPADATEIAMRFDYAGMQNGQVVLWKVYSDGTEDESLRTVETWAQGPQGSTTKVLRYAESNLFAFTPGAYAVDMYVNSRLAQTGTFIIPKIK